MTYATAARLRDYSADVRIVPLTVFPSSLIAVSATAWAGLELIAAEHEVLQH